MKLNLQSGTETDCLQSIIKQLLKLNKRCKKSLPNTTLVKNIQNDIVCTIVVVTRAPNDTEVLSRRDQYSAVI